MLKTFVFHAVFIEKFYGNSNPISIMQISLTRGTMDLYMDTPIQYLKGVGPKLGELLTKKGMGTLGALYENYPRSYEDRRVARTIASLKSGETVGIKAQIIHIGSQKLGKSHRRIHDITIGDDSGQIHCKFFKQPYRGYFERFQKFMYVRVTGKVTHYRGQREFHHPEVQEFKADGEMKDELVPIYSEIERFPGSRLRKIIMKAIEFLKKDQVRGGYEKLPPWILESYKLPNLRETLIHIHSPPFGASDDFFKYRSPYHQRLIFEEFFWLEIILAARKQGLQKETAPVFFKTRQLPEKLQASLNFQLTSAQIRVFMEIRNDLKRNFPMHRLIQGDVGSGKTLVAFLSALTAIENSCQVALMVPTEILARQHYLKAVELLKPLGLKVGFISGHLGGKEKKEINEKISCGELDLVVGTHALIQDTVEFRSLGLVIVDEQHRFGVEQRKKLIKKGKSPHFLLMTATPIPRSLAMTVYGDLDVSVIDEMPEGRKPVITRVTYQSRRQKILDFIKDHLKRGRQAYMVFPLVDESEKMELSSAIQEFERLKNELPDFKLNLLHGKMKSREKDQIMEDFRNRKTDVLVSTTVIEVGVDVPNANIIWIDHAERFGLSQLHQLRGRVGRGGFRSYCILSLGFAVSEDSRTRINLMETISDGFRIAEADLELRGPGEFLGSKQSGLPGFRMANIVRDLSILQKAREAAFSVIQKDPKLIKKENQFLRKEVFTNEKMIG